MSDKLVELGETGYYTGNLYVQMTKDVREQVELFIPDENHGFMYDEDRGNVHYIPVDTEFCIKCENDVQEKRAQLIQYLKDNSGVLKAINKKVILNMGKDKENGDGSRGFIQNKEYNEFLKRVTRRNYGLFKYFKVECENRTYELIFNRFYTDETNKKINCILNGLQFEAYTKEIKSISIYPHTAKAWERTPFNANDAFAHYYNPKSSFYDDNESICKEFIKFIEYNEMKYLLGTIDKK